MKTPNVTEQPQDAAAGCAPATGSASPAPTQTNLSDVQHEDEWDGEDNDSCHYCGGDGVMMGDELDDPLWYDRATVYRCPCCNGSGNAKDCTFW